MVWILIGSLLLCVSLCQDITGSALRYGSLVRIKSSTTNHYLHSHKVPIQMDGPYSVTGFWLDNDANSLWSLQDQYSPSKYSHKSYKNTIQCSDTITLIHSLTGGSLQSFQQSVGMTAPEQLVTNSPHALQSNSNWMVQCEDFQVKQLAFGTRFRLRHLNSNKYLEISKEHIYDDYNCGRGCIIKNHLEIHAVRERTPSTVLIAVGGVTFVE